MAEAEAARALAERRCQAVILDSGTCGVYRAADISSGGAMPHKSYSLIAEGWYAELSFETSPRWETDGRVERVVDKRIRILQCTAIRQNDIVVLHHTEPAEQQETFRIIRAFHGADADTTDLISDLSLEVVRP